MGAENVDALVRFARVAAEARGADGVFSLLADALVTHVEAGAVALVEVLETGELRLAPSSHLPRELEGFALDPDELGEALGARMLKACKKKFVSVRSRPLVSGGGLFGSVVMFFAKGHGDAEALRLADGLVDVAAIALENAAKLRQIVRSNADLRASEEVLARSEKLRALGQMAAGVSHDLKNILNPLSLHLQVIARALDRGELDDARESIAEMKQVLARGVQTIEVLRDYGRQTPESRVEAVELDRLMREAKEVARARMVARKRTLRFVEELGAPPPVTGRSGEIVGALVNLIVNAIDATERGAITLRTGAADGKVFAEVCDEGAGMPPEVERHVFEPFFSTKGEEGTGLGLSMVYACMKRHGGSVKLVTAPGKGTSVILQFPSGGADAPR